MSFSPKKYSTLKRRLQQKYDRDLQSTLKFFKSRPKTELSQWLKEHEAYLHGYTPVKWYFLKQLRTYLEFTQAIPKLSSDPESFTADDDVAFERWNQSEFADVFLKSLNRGKGMKVATELTLTQLGQHLQTLGARSLLREDAQSAAYRIQGSLGEVKKGKRAGRLLETTLHFEGKDLGLMTKSLKEMKNFSQRIELALKVIRKHSPDSWERFRAFTEVIIPISQTEFVSYSHQELPGHSMINLYDRDFVDLMDDLLHENGHHHLNYYLNLGKVIDEPQDCIYYSPWRRTLRPLRGIYHAYFTFFWAFELFSSLAQAKDMDSIYYVFGPKEKEKILWRAVEEYWMLHYTFQDLKRAKNQGLITDTGWKLVSEQQQRLLRAKKKIALWEKSLKAHRASLRELKATLKSAEKLYRPRG